MGPLCRWVQGLEPLGTASAADSQPFHAMPWPWLCRVLRITRPEASAPMQAEPVAPKPVLGGLRRTASGNLVPVADDAPIQ